MSEGEALDSITDILDICGVGDSRKLDVVARVQMLATTRVRVYETTETNRFGIKFRVCGSCKQRIGERGNHEPR